MADSKFIQLNDDGTEVPGASFVGEIIAAVKQDERILLLFLLADGRIKQVELILETGFVPKGKVDLV